MASLENLVQEWLRLDRNITTRQEIQDLCETEDTAELEKRMRPRIEFGTAGLRGKMEAGWSRMNGKQQVDHGQGDFAIYLDLDLIVLQTTQGLCAYVLAQVTGARSRGVVIGHDHRHNSERWAQLAAAIFLDQGVKTYLLRGLVHTPMVPFSVKRLGAACGIMITGNHNPKQDNGYKVYWENAVQIIGPHDKGISNFIKVDLQPRSWDREVDKILASPLCVDDTQELIRAYFDSLTALNVKKSINKACTIKFVNTSMHGVSDSFTNKAFTVFGFPPYIAVCSQQYPDADFPTVHFPNPEEKGALDLAIETANAEGADYILAEDPDADRFSAAEKNGDGTWTIFTGDQIGALFAAHILDVYRSSSKPVGRLAMVASTVSSKMIEAMSIAEGFTFRECLTGFKYIGNTSLDLVTEGFEVLFGYEEAIGYMIGSEIRDKDGVYAAVFFAQLVAMLHTQGKTAMSFLQELYDKYGFFKTSNSYFVCDKLDTIDIIFNRLRKYKEAHFPSYPSQIAGLQVTRVVDLTVGYDSGNPPAYKPKLPLSSGHMIQFRAESGDGLKIVLTIRTSGTEPKIKYYLEGNGKDRQAVSALLPRVVTELGETWLEAEKHGLGCP
ncbi:hypothetical protein AX17_003359 [Amanita inopinata Kibby_2008]|nr:hypothetical protein AX17_003359 [Amanita inopinata Kibby_2008]